MIYQAKNKNFFIFLYVRYLQKFGRYIAFTYLFV